VATTLFGGLQADTCPSASIDCARKENVPVVWLGKVHCAWPRFDPTAISVDNRSLGSTSSTYQPVLVVHPSVLYRKRTRITCPTKAEMSEVTCAQAGETPLILFPRLRWFGPNMVVMEPGIATKLRASVATST
jgi:hypothetical protein